MMPPRQSGVHDPPLALSSDHVRVAKRRIAAFGVDYLIIATWIGLITAVGFGARAFLGIETAPVLSQGDKLRGHAIAFLSLTLPVVLYFAITESSRWQATVGKRMLGLRGKRSAAHGYRSVEAWLAQHSSFFHGKSPTLQSGTSPASRSCQCQPQSTSSGTRLHWPELGPLQ
jgi:RDD family